MKLNQLYETIDLSNTSLNDETPPDDTYNLMGFEAANINDEEQVTLMKDAKIIMSASFEEVKNYLVNNIKSLFGTYHVIVDGETLYSIDLAG
jgi:hypothetical protein